MKRLRADDSADSRVKVGHRQALPSTPQLLHRAGVFAFGGSVRDWRAERGSSIRRKRTPIKSGL